MKTTRGFSIIELLVTLILITLLACVLIPMLSKSKLRAKESRCSSQVRSLVQGLQLWASNNRNAYPLASSIDAGDDTVAQRAQAKDTSSNIFAIMIQNRVCDPAELVCPSESNTSITVCTDYQYQSPARAVRPERALWDPAFSADFTSARGGFVSYAHLQPSADRVKRWGTTFASDEPILGDRGPQVTQLSRTGDPVAYALSSESTGAPTSISVSLHGSYRGWRGHLAYNDGHVDFERQMTAPNARPIDTSRSDSALDCPFFDEPSVEGNTFLGLFIKAGKFKNEFQPIWD
jgi:prepilin-type N-terminal cleavage/methylation domain-containing protein